MDKFRDSVGHRNELLQSPRNSREKTENKLNRRESDAKTAKKIGHRRITDKGTVTYKKTPTFEIQNAIQFGIQHSISMLQKKPDRDILMKDFEVVETVDFPRSGTKQTPVHSFSDFRFRTIAPVAFRFFRQHFNLDITDYLTSLCILKLRELSNPGASGSIFYISADDKFIIKTVQHKEADFLQKLLPEYYLNLVQHKETLLPKFAGLYCYMTLGKNIRFIVMNNLLPTSIKIHEKYDLKGSSYKRKANATELAKDSPTLKDLDFKERHPEGLFLEHEVYDALMKKFERDCRVLESFAIMDYSLLLGIHNFDQAQRDKGQGKQSNNVEETQSFQFPVADLRLHTSATGDDPSNHVPIESKPVNYLKKKHPFFSGKLQFNSHSDTPQPTEMGQDLPSPESDNLNDLLHEGIPAKSKSGDRLILFLGIIDILQSYRVAKKMEHTLKSTFIDATTVSVTNPAFYAKRFQQNLGQYVFIRIKSPMKQNSARRKTANYQRPPMTPRQADSLRFVNNRNTDCEASVTTWPRFHYNNAAAPKSNHLNSYYAFRNRTSSAQRLYTSDNVSESLPYSSYSFPKALENVENSPFLYRTNPVQFRDLSWCAQSILSLTMDSEAGVSDDLTDSSLSISSHDEVERNDEKHLTPRPSFKSQPEEININDTTLVLDKGSPTSHVSNNSMAVQDLDSDLLAFQKMIRKQCTLTRAKENAINSLPMYNSLSKTSQRTFELSPINHEMSQALSFPSNDMRHSIFPSGGTCQFLDNRSKINKSKTISTDAANDGSNNSATIVKSFMQEAEQEFNLGSPIINHKEPNVNSNLFLSKNSRLSSRERCETKF